MPKQPARGIGPVHQNWPKENQISTKICSKKHRGLLKHEIPGPDIDEDREDQIKSIPS